MPSQRKFQVRHSEGGTPVGSQVPGWRPRCSSQQLQARESCPSLTGKVAAVNFLSTHGGVIPRSAFKNKLARRLQGVRLANSLWHPLERLRGGHLPLRRLPGRDCAWRATESLPSFGFPYCTWEPKPYPGLHTI